MLLGSSTLQAQSNTTSYGLQIGDISMAHVANRLEVDFTILIDGVKIRSNQALRITPYVTDGEEMIQLPAVVIDGRRRHIVHERNRSDMVASADTYVRHRKREAQLIDYETDVAFEKWMSNSELILREECISCHDLPLDETLVAVAILDEQQTPATAAEALKSASSKPQFAYVTPQISPASEMQSIDIFFPVNRSVINPSFMGNSASIEQLQNSLKQGSDIKTIQLVGYSSPEGPYTFNEQLAAKRAEAVKQHIEKSNLPADITISTDSSPADWAEVKKLLNDSSIENYLKIIAIIDDENIAPADKNKTIKEQYPVEYDFMLRTWYPHLRKTEISFYDGKKTMSFSEAKAQLNKDPKQLSLEDIYMVALTYDKRSKEWEDIVIIAVEAYPQSPEARINAANVAMANGNFQQAATFLEGVPSTIPQAMNSRGILAMEQGKYGEAMQLFQAAEKAGVSEAAQNITLLKELMAAEN